VGRRFPKTAAQVQQFIEEEWVNLQVSDYEHYIKEMPERVEAVITANSGHTKW
jgi:hypothetical protein